jgi:hypothetical protein
MRTCGQAADRKFFLCFVFVFLKEVKGNRKDQFTCKISQGMDNEILYFSVLFSYDIRVPKK